MHSDSYDTWRERESFALAASGGSPPDLFFAEGQEWGFPPLHPEGIREIAIRYPIACLRQLLGRARALRIDHVMGLHRLFWVPRGFSAADGVYVSYPADELYAILCLEAERAGTMVVGEDLGTVPDGVRETMERARRAAQLRAAVLGLARPAARASSAPPAREPRDGEHARHAHSSPRSGATPSRRCAHAVDALPASSAAASRTPDEPGRGAVLRACLEELARRSTPRRCS